MLSFGTLNGYFACTENSVARTLPAAPGRAPKITKNRIIWAKGQTVCPSSILRTRAGQRRVAENRKGGLAKGLFRPADRAGGFSFTGDGQYCSASRDRPVVRSAIAHGPAPAMQLNASPAF